MFQTAVQIRKAWGSWERPTSSIMVSRKADQYKGDSSTSALSYCLISNGYVSVFLYYKTSFWDKIVGKSCLPIKISVELHSEVENSNYHENRGFTWSC